MIFKRTDVAAEGELGQENARRWIEILWPVLVVVAGFVYVQSGQQTEIDFIKNELVDMKSLPAKTAELSSQLREMQSSLQQERRVTELERKALRNELTSQVVLLLAKVETMEGNITRIWPRLRALNINNGLIKQAIERQHPDVTVELPPPEKY